MSFPKGYYHCRGRRWLPRKRHPDLENFPSNLIPHFLMGQSKQEYFASSCYLSEEGQLPPLAGVVFRSPEPPYILEYVLDVFYCEFSLMNCKSDTNKEDYLLLGAEYLSTSGCLRGRFILPLNQRIWKGINTKYFLFALPDRFEGLRAIHLESHGAVQVGGYEIAVVGTSSRCNTTAMRGGTNKKCLEICWQIWIEPRLWCWCKTSEALICNAWLQWDFLLSDKPGSLESCNDEDPSKLSWSLN